MASVPVAWAQVEHTDVAELRGPLVVVRGAKGVGWDELASIRLASGETRHGLVLEVDRDLAVVQVLEGTDGIDPTGTRVVFSGHPLRIPVGPGWLGRICNGRGQPIDGGPPVFDPEEAPVNGAPLNPTLREPPAEPVLTGVSAIDALTTLVRGQKLPIFSTAGLPHLTLATQVAAQASAGGEPFSVVVAAMGLSHADAAAVRDALEERSAAGELALLLNLADDPAIERILIPRIALTVAEHLAFALGRHVLVVMADMTSYCEAVREVSIARGEIPARRAYPGLPVLRPGLPVRALWAHPRDRRLGHRAAGAHHAGRRHHPPGARPDRVHHRRPGRAVRRGPRPRDLPARRRAVVAVAADAQGRRPRPHPPRAPGPGRPAAGRARPGAAGRELAELVGTGALSATDRGYLELERAFERVLVSQRPDERRSLDETFERAWRVLAALPTRELTMMAAADLDAHYQVGDDRAEPEDRR